MIVTRPERAAHAIKHRFNTSIYYKRDFIKHGETAFHLISRAVFNAASLLLREKIHICCRLHIQVVNMAVKLRYLSVHLVGAGVGDVDDAGR